MSDEAEIQALNDEGSTVLTRISQCRRDAQVFTASQISPSTATTTVSTSNEPRQPANNMKLQHVTPPKF